MLAAAGYVNAVYEGYVLTWAAIDAVASAVAGEDAVGAVAAAQYVFPGTADDDVVAGPA